MYSNYKASDFRKTLAALHSMLNRNKFIDDYKVKFTKGNAIRFNVDDNNKEIYLELPKLLFEKDYVHTR